MAEDAECLSGAKSGGRHDPRSIRIRKLEEEKHVAEMQASTELDMRSKTPELKGATSTTALQKGEALAEGTSSNGVRTTAVVVASSAESSARSFGGWTTKGDAAHLDQLRSN